MLLENHSKITTPVQAYITFTTQEGYERCMKNLASLTHYGNVNEDQKEFEILEAKVDICQASEPTDIIWECQGHTETHIETM